MADLRKLTDAFAYIEFRVERRHFDSLVRKFGSRAGALREIRCAWPGVLASLVVGGSPDRSDAAAPRSAP